MPLAPGESGNPLGNKADKLWRDAIRIAAQDKLPDGRRKLRAIAERVVDLALHGEPAAAISAAKEIGDRLDGKSVTPIEHSGELIHQFPVDRPPAETREVWIGRRSKELGLASAVLGRTAGTAD